jgi:hypothetical protein
MYMDVVIVSGRNRDRHLLSVTRVSVGLICSREVWELRSIRVPTVSHIS